MSKRSTCAFFRTTKSRITGAACREEGRLFFAGRQPDESTVGQISRSRGEIAGTFGGLEKKVAATRRVTDVRPRGRGRRGQEESARLAKESHVGET